VHVLFVVTLRLFIRVPSSDNKNIICNWLDASDVPQQVMLLTLINIRGHGQPSHLILPHGIQTIIILLLSLKASLASTSINMRDLGRVYNTSSNVAIK
jgi:hypothetical protein